MPIINIGNKVCLPVIEKVAVSIKLARENKMRDKRKGFTLVELMVVILIVGILAAINIPLMKARIDKSKWTEACTSAGLIRRALYNYAVIEGISDAQGLVGNDLSDFTTQQDLGFASTDLEGTYFKAGDYEIISVNAVGNAAIKVTGGSKTNSPGGSYILTVDGIWEKQ